MAEPRTTIQDPSPWSNIHFFITFVPGALGSPNAHCPFPSVTRGHMTLMKLRHFKPSKNSFSPQISKDNLKQSRQRVIGSLLASQPGWSRRLLAQEEPTMSSSGREKTREYALAPHPRHAHAVPEEPDWSCRNQMISCHFCWRTERGEWFVLYGALGGKEEISETVQSGSDEKIIKATSRTALRFGSDNKIIDSDGWPEGWESEDN